MTHDTAAVLLALVALAQGLLTYLKYKKAKRPTRQSVRIVLGKVRPG